MARPLPYPVYDADNHLYESQEAMTAHRQRIMSGNLKALLAPV